MFEINVIKTGNTCIKVKENPILKGKEQPTHIFKYEWEYKGGCPIIGVYDTSFNIIIFNDYIDTFKVDGIEYKLIYIYEIEKVR